MTEVQMVGRDRAAGRYTETRRRRRPLLGLGSVLALLSLLLGTVGGAVSAPEMLWGRPALHPAAWDPRSWDAADGAVVTEAAWAATAGGARAEVLVLLRDQVDVATIVHERAADRVVERGRAVFEMLKRTAATSQAPLCTWLELRGIPYRPFYIINALLVEADAGLLRKLARRPEVAQIITNPEITLPLLPSTPAPGLSAMAAVPWGVAQIGAPEVWAMGYRGQGVVVAGQDTGYDWTHPALQDQYRGWDGVTADHDYNWHDAIHDDGGRCGADSPVPCDDQGHGTHTLGTIVGDGGTAYPIGIAPEAQWIGCRNMSEGVGTPATYAECFEYFLAPYPVGGTPEQGDPDRAPDVINNSWSCPPSEGCGAAQIAFLEQVVENVRAAGILVVASAGNRGSACGTVDQPAGMYAATFTVGATDSQDRVASFSSRGADNGLLKPDIVAPGVNVLSALPGGGYGSKSGTSMAAPHVVGASALVLSANPALRGQVSTVEALLMDSAVAYTSGWCGDAPDAVPNAVYGWGRLNALGAVEAALGEVGILNGRVVAPSGQPLAAAHIGMVRDVHGPWTQDTDDAGRYQVHIPSGVYTVTASHPHFLSSAYPGVVVSGGLTTTLDITLTHPYRLYLPNYYLSVFPSP